MIESIINNFVQNDIHFDKIYSTVETELSPMTQRTLKFLMFDHKTKHLSPDMSIQTVIYFWAAEQSIMNLPKFWGRNPKATTKVTLKQNHQKFNMDWEITERTTRTQLHSCKSRSP